MSKIVALALLALLGLVGCSNPAEPWPECSEQTIVMYEHDGEGHGHNQRHVVVVDVTYCVEARGMVP